MYSVYSVYSAYNVNAVYTAWTVYAYKPTVLRHGFPELVAGTTPQQQTNGEMKGGIISYNLFVFITYIIFAGP